jgi:UDP-GlcNAc:undecaprenyl-phosphate GlcNAc-1-phosphate transferase
MVAALALAGALSGFLVFNFPPASIFMGDAGALTVGLILGALSIQASHLHEGSLPARLAMPLLALAVPLIDTVTVTVTRLATGNPISKRGLDHSHHRLARLGLSNTTAAGTLVALQVIAGACAVALGLVPGYEAALLLPYIGLFFALVTLFLMDRTFDAEAQGRVDELPAIARMILNFGYKRRLVEAVLDAALVAAAYFGATLLRYDFHLEPYNVAMMLEGLPWIVAIGCGSFIIAGVYRGIWRYTGLAEGVRFAVASVMAGAAVLAASAFVPIAIGRAATIVFVLLMFNLLVATRWSFHLFRRIGRWLATPTTRAVIVGADAHGQAAIQHLQAALGIGAELVGVVDDDSFKHGKLFHGYPVLGSIDELDEIIDRTPFDEIVIAQETLSPVQMNLLQNFARARRLSVRRFWLEVADLTALDNFAVNRAGLSPAPEAVRSAASIGKNPRSLRS